jgi:hypothetical protein
MGVSAKITAAHHLATAKCQLHLRPANTHSQAIKQIGRQIIRLMAWCDRPFPLGRSW